MRLALVPAALVAIAPASAFAVHYLSAEQAQKLMFPDAERFEVREFAADAGSTRAGSAPMQVRIARRGQATLGYVVVDEVIGKFELITYAAGLNRDGSVRQVEVMDYRESHGYEIRLPAWRRQFEGRTAASPIRVGDDIANISGATLSCRHVTDGVRRIVARIDALRRSGALS
ncbi:MAG: FMN-binding protein [Burkholderiaceae bacterium]|nr:FMN-binding protein [Burkholderiaceae bacterium]